MYLLQLPCYPKRDKQEPLPYWVDVQVDLSVLVMQVSFEVLSCAGLKVIAPDIVMTMAITEDDLFL